MRAVSKETLEQNAESELSRAQVGFEARLEALESLPNERMVSMMAAVQHGWNTIAAELAEFAASSLKELLEQVA